MGKSKGELFPCTLTRVCCASNLLRHTQVCQKRTANNVSLFHIAASLRMLSLAQHDENQQCYLKLQTKSAISKFIKYFCILQIFLQSLPTTLASHDENDQYYLKLQVKSPISKFIKYFCILQIFLQSRRYWFWRRWRCYKTTRVLYISCDLYQLIREQTRACCEAIMQFVFVGRN